MKSISNPFYENDMLKSLVEEEPNLLGALCRAGLSFGFGDKTISAACREDGVDCPTFMAICNLLCHRPYTDYNVSLPALMAYLRRSHVYFLDYMLPAIRRKLIVAINCSDVNDIAFLLIKFFDDYVQEVTTHMNHENEEVFSYVDSLLEAKIPAGSKISEYSLTHESMAEKLAELKDIFIYHYHVRENEALTSALADIIQCGKELTEHCEVENKLFIPAVQRLEDTLAQQSDTSDHRDEKRNDDTDEILSSREKDIIREVAKGLSNKQIAAKLFLSVHTVATHRRNIASKLNIHSAAGLTIYAILHNIVRMDEIKDPTAAQ